MGYAKESAPALKKWADDNGVNKQINDAMATADAIRNKNKGRTVKQVLSELTRKVNTLTRANVENETLKKSMVKLTKQISSLSQDQVSQHSYADKKMNEILMGQVSKMEGAVNAQI